MILFKTYCKLLPFLVGYDVLTKYDIKPPNDLQRRMFRITNVLGYVVMVSGLIETTLCAAFEIHTLQDIANNVYSLTTLANDTFFFISLKWRYEKCLKMVDTYGNIVKNRT